MLMLIFVFDLVAPDMLGRSINRELHTLSGKGGGHGMRVHNGVKGLACILGYEGGWLA